MGSIPMPLATLTCPGCKVNLKPNKPVPPGKKVKCPKCATIFVTGNGAPPPTSGIQAKAPPPPQQEDQDQGWEIVDDKPIEAFNVEQAVAKAPQIDYDDQPKAKPKPKSTRRPVPRDEDEDEEEADEDEEDYQEDDYEDEEDEEEERPRRASRKKTPSGGGNKALLVILLVVGAAFLLLAAGGGAGYYWFLNRNRNRGPGTEDPLAFLPADCAVIVGVDMGALMEQPAIALQIQQSIRRNNNTFLADCKRDTGIEFKDMFDHVVMASKVSAGGGAETWVLVIRSKVPFSQNKVHDSLKEPTAHKHQGKTYYKVNEAGFNTVFMPSDRILVLTNAADATVQQIVGSDGSSSKIPADTLDMIRNLGKASAGWAVMSIEGDIRNSIQSAAKTAPAEFRGLVQAFSQAKALGLNFAVAGGSVSAQMKLHCTDEKTAKQVASQLQSLWDKQFKGVGGAQMMVMLNLVPKEVKLFLQELIDSTKFMSQGSMAEASAKVSTTTLQAALTQFQMMGMQQGGFQGPGGFRGGPPRGGMRGGP